MDFDRQALKSKVAELAAKNVFIGTSSWKYQGWNGMLYDESRYVYRGKFAEKRFEKNCLDEYAEVFKTVSVDATYYTFPKVETLEGLAAQVPADFRFGFKVTGEITLKHFHNQPRFAKRAGKPNEHFLDIELFEKAFLKPCEAIRAKVGILMFEFSRFYPTDYEHGRDFVSALDSFLSKLPTGWPYGIEMRNKNWLKPEYFECLHRHQVAHVFNSWEEMPTVNEQMALPGSETNPELVAARFLLKPGRKYADAVSLFKPYDTTKEVNEDARKAGTALIEKGKKATKRKTFIFVNNRLEGNALHTINAILEAVRAE